MKGCGKRWLATAVDGMLLAGILVGCRTCSVRDKEVIAAMLRYLREGRFGE